MILTPLYMYLVSLYMKIAEELEIKFLCGFHNLLSDTVSGGSDTA